MNDKRAISRLLFYWGSSYLIASFSYYVLRLIMPEGYVFGALYRMFLYHWAFPLQYIAIPCFFYGIIASLLANTFQKNSTQKRILLTFLIIVSTIFISSPFGGMLWHFHDMQAGHFPANWFSKMIKLGFTWGFETGWLVIALSIPYNIFGSIVCFFLTKKGVEVFETK